jgi:aspartate aminotransferase
VTNAYFSYIRPAEDRDSPTYAAASKGKALKAAHADAILLTLGELDISPSEKDLDAWREKAADQLFRQAGTGRKYPPDIGTEEFRREAAKLFSSETGIAVDANDIVVSMGGKGVLCGLGSAYKPGDQVLLAAPGWPTNYDIWRDGVEMIEVDTDGRGLMSAEQLAQALKDYPEVKAVLINDPCNPTGARYTPAEREAVMKTIAAHKGIVAIIDDPYGALTYNGATMKRSAEETKLFNAGGIVVVNSVSKVYASPDMRVGYAVSKNKDALKAVALFNKNKGCSVAAKMQNDAQLLLMFGENFKTETKARLEKRASLLVEKMTAIGLPMQKPQGAIYGWVNCSSLKGKSYTGSDGKKHSIAKPADVADFMRDVAQVAPVDGEPFYAPGSPAADKKGWYVRIVLAAEESLSKACDNLGKALKSLKGQAAA